MSFAYMALYTGDYLRDTRHLTPLRHGIYLLALMHCWDSQGPMPLDEQECAGICNCRSADEIDALRYVLNRYFVRMEDGRYNKRIQQEIERAAAISDKRAGAAAERWKARDSLRRMSAAIHANALQVQSTSNATPPSPSPSPPLQKNKTKENVRREAPQPRLTALFSRFWDAWPKTPRKAARKQCEAKWRSLGCDAIADQILAAVADQIPAWKADGYRYCPAPLTWLNQTRWEAPATAVVAEEVRPWHETRSGVERMAATVGIAPWDECVQWSVYKSRVMARITTEAKQ